MLNAIISAGAALLGLIFALRHRARLRTRRNAVLCGDAARLLAACPSLASYAPPLLLPISGHASTLFSVFFRRSPGLTFSRELVALPDGGEIALDFRGPVPQGARVVLLLHGLTGGSHERYVQWQIRALEAACSPPPVCVVLNARGCGGSGLRTPLSFSAAFTADVRAVVRLLCARAGAGGRVSAVGWSLGAGTLLKFVCEEGGAAGGGSAGQRLHAAAALAPSVDFFRSCARLERPLARLLYNLPMARALHRYLRPHAALLRTVPGFDEAAALSAPTLRGVDCAAIVPLHGFADVAAYYAAASTVRELKHAALPVLVLAARDDPICDVGGLEEGARAASGCVAAVVTEEGGHVAWPLPSPGGWLLPGCELSWENAAVVEWLKHVGGV
jgi:predicted alpha/beta-fold hydrolase